MNTMYNFTGQVAFVTGDAAQRRTLEDLVAADMVTRGDILDRFYDDVAYSLRMLLEPSPPTDTDSAFPLP